MKVTKYQFVDCKDHLVTWFDIVAFDRIFVLTLNPIRMRIYKIH